MPYPQSCHLEEGGENGEAEEEEIELSFEVGGIKQSLKKGMGDPDFIIPHSVSSALGPALGGTGRGVRAGGSQGSSGGSCGPRQDA